jgi:catechol 2,3-dioxygenase-like lactoylglutathione lyase family enzyme
MTITPQLDMIGIVVSDMARSLAFYRELGVDVPGDAAEQPHVEVTLDNGVRIAWDTVATVQSFLPDFRRATGDGGVSLAFRLDTPADVDATYQRLADAGFTGRHAPWDAFWGQRYAIVHDPDGNAVDLFASLPDTGAGQ